MARPALKPRHRMIQAMRDDCFRQWQIREAMAFYDRRDLDGMREYVRATHTERAIRHERLAQSSLWLQPAVYLAENSD